MEFKVKNMVCQHCVRAVERALGDAGFDVLSVELGTARVGGGQLSEKSLARLDAALRSEGFERVTDPRDAVVERVKHAIMRHVREENCKFNLSACLSDHVGIEYDTLSRIFSAREGRTIEKYFIAQRVELVKELLGYGTLTLTEIADKAGYSSVAHLSRQFKTVTGLTPTQYLADMAASSRIPLSEV